MTDSLIDRIQTLVRDHYVFADRGESIAAALNGITLPADEPALATAVTEALLAASADKHLRVRHYPDGVPTDQDEAAARAHWAAEMRRTSGGVAEVLRLDAATGLLALGPVIGPREPAAPYLAAAFALLADVERLVIDLRACVGGVPETVAYIVSHLTGPEPVHLQDVVRRDGTADSYWTTSDVDALPPTVEVAVLTSSATFSGGEELAYDLQALGRATVVGEVTGGGAHPREAFDLSPTLQVHVPVARSVNAVTGTNWEGKGVLPDHPCPADQALEVALAG
ncbi:S41 family peptidase [Nocardioides speluncae]|uniref:S41 family peptidase n=1 Tax=Nocardioides speluncae TaxID=2670337 RepID=UPI000D6859AD|nr:S41 family peptidase [Nocardioides speluncae]